MRILADENFPLPAIKVLRTQGHDVVWARTDCPGLPDRTLLENAEANERLIFTLDKDLWQLALQRPAPLKRSGVILFRVIPAIPEKLEPLVNVVLRAECSWTGHVTIVSQSGIEMFPADSRRRDQG